MFAKRQKKSLKLSMTPLIDMVFLLLVFFMLTTSFSNKHVIELNYSSHGQPSLLAASNDFILVSIEPGNIVVVNENASPFAHFAGTITPLLQRNNQQRIFIQTIGEPTVQEVVNVIDILNKLGAGNVTFLEQNYRTSELLP